MEKRQWVDRAGRVTENLASPCEIRKRPGPRTEGGLGATDKARSASLIGIPLRRLRLCDKGAERRAKRRTEWILHVFRHADQVGGEHITVVWPSVAGREAGRAMGKRSEAREEVKWWL